MQIECILASAFSNDLWPKVDTYFCINAIPINLYVIDSAIHWVDLPKRKALVSEVRKSDLIL